MSFNGFCRKCEAGEPHGICCEPWWSPTNRTPNKPPTNRALNILRERVEHRRAMLQRDYSPDHLFLAVYLGAFYSVVTCREGDDVPKGVLPKPWATNIRTGWLVHDFAPEESGSALKPLDIECRDMDEAVKTMVSLAQEQAKVSPTPDMWDGIERGIRVEGGSIPSYVPPSATSQQFVPAPRSCPTCGPCPGGPGSTPLNETDKSCWRCGRTDLS